MNLGAGNLATGDYFTVQVPSPGSFTSSSSTTKCALKTPTGSVTSCSITSSTATIHVAVTGSSNTFTIQTVSNFNNPPSSTPLTITVSRYSSSGSLLESSTGSLTNVSPAQMASNSISALNQQIGATQTSLQFKFVNTNTLTANGRIRVIFPLWNPNDVVNNQMQMVSTSAPTCVGVQNINPSSCIYNNANQQLTLYNVVSTDAAAGTTFQFTVSNILNPYSAKPKTGFTVTTQDSVGGSIDQDSSATLTVTIPASFTKLQLQLASSTIGAQTTYKFSYQVNLPIDANCIMKIVGPSQLDMHSYFQMVNGYSVFSGASVNSFAAASDNSITVEGCNSYYDQASNTDLLEVNQVVNPGQIMDTSKFMLYLYAVQGTTSYIVAQDLVTLYVQKTQLTSGIITNMAIVAVTSTVVQESTSYAISFTPTDNLSSASKIVIQFPTSDAFFKLAASTSCTLSSVSGGFVSNPTSCVISSANSITLTYPFGSIGTYTGGTPLTFTIASGINPTSVTDAGTFVFNTYNTLAGVDYQVDSGSGSGLFTPTIGTIVNNLDVISTSYKTFDQPVTYSIKFSPAHTIPKNGILQLTIPTSSIPIFSSSTLLAQVYVATDTGSYVTTSSVSLNSGVLTINDAFTSGSWVPGVTGSYLTVKIGGLTNPRSLAQSASFQVLSQDPSGYSIDKITNGLQIIMLTINDLISVTVTPTSLINGASTPYTIAVTLSTPLINSDKFTLTFPNEVVLPIPISCSTGTALIGVSCVKNGQVVTASLTFLGGTVASGQTFTFSIPNMKNPPDTRPTSVFTDIFATDLSGIKISQYITPTINIKTTTAATITSSSLYQVSQQALASTIYTLAVTTINPMPASGAFVVSYPNIVSISSISTCEVTLAGTIYPMTCLLNSNAQKITVKGGGLPIIDAGTQVQIALGPFINPALGYSGSDSLGVSSYTDSTTVYIVDTASTNMVPGLICNSPCKTCTVNSKSQCTTCFTDGTTIYQYLYSSTCLQSCPTGYYPDSSKICQRCSLKCKTCSSSSTCDTCDTSSSSNFQYMYSQMCFQTCPVNTYSDNYVCNSCQLPCQTCTGPSNGNCLTCSISYNNPLLYQMGNTCLASCASGYVPINYQCVKCSSPCLTCTINQGTCTSCVSNFYLYGTTCVQACPSGYIKNDITQKCIGCDPKCAQCTGSASTCIQCLTGFILYNNVCYSSCPTGYQLSSDKSTCTKETIIIITPNTTIDTNKTTNTTSNTTTSNVTTNTTTKSYSSSINGYPYLDLGFLLYFPFLLLTAIAFLISIGSYLKYKQSLITSNAIALWGPIEFFALLAQIILAAVTEQKQLAQLTGFYLFGNSSSSRRLLFSTSFMPTSASSINYGYPIVLLATLFALVMLIFVNILFSTILCCHQSIRNDPLFKEWRKKHPLTVCCIHTWGSILSFKLGRFFYSRFFAYKSCNAEFKKVRSYYAAINCLSIANIFFSLLPIIFIDIWALTIYKWGSQFYIILIETLVISILMLIFIILDFRVGVKETEQAKKVMNDSALDQLKINDFSNLIERKFSEHKQWMEKEKILLTPGSRSNIFFNDMDQDYESKLRKDAIEHLKRKMSSTSQFYGQPETKSQMPQRGKQSGVHSNLRKRRYSDEPDEAEKEIIDDQPIARSYPVSPKAYSEYNNDYHNQTAGYEENYLPKSQSKSVSQVQPKMEQIMSLKNKAELSQKSQETKQGNQNSKSIDATQLNNIQKETPKGSLFKAPNAIPQSKKDSLNYQASQISLTNSAISSHTGESVNSEDALKKMNTVMSQKKHSSQQTAQSRDISQLSQRPSSQNDNKWVQKHPYEYQEEEIIQIEDQSAKVKMNSRPLSQLSKKQPLGSEKSNLRASPSKKEFIMPQPEEEEINKDSLRNSKKKKAGRGKKDAYDNMVDDEYAQLMDQDNQQQDTNQNDNLEIQLYSEGPDYINEIMEDDYLQTGQNGDDLEGTGSNLIKQIRDSQDSSLRIGSGLSKGGQNSVAEDKNNIIQQRAQSRIQEQPKTGQSQLSKKQVSFVDLLSSQPDQEKRESNLQDYTSSNQQPSITEQQYSQRTDDNEESINNQSEPTVGQSQNNPTTMKQLSFQDSNKSGTRPQTQQANLRQNEKIGPISQKSSAYDPTNNNEERESSRFQGQFVPSKGEISETSSQKTHMKFEKQNQQPLLSNDSQTTLNQQRADLEKNESQQCEDLSDQTRQEKRQKNIDKSDASNDIQRRTSLGQSTKMARNSNKDILSEKVVTNDPLCESKMTQAINNQENYDDIIQEQKIDTLSDIRENDFEGQVEANIKHENGSSGINSIKNSKSSATIAQDNEKRIDQQEEDNLIKLILDDQSNRSKSLLKSQNSISKVDLKSENQEIVQKSQSSYTESKMSELQMDDIIEPESRTSQLQHNKSDLTKYNNSKSILQSQASIFEKDSDINNNAQQAQPIFKSPQSEKRNQSKLSHQSNMQQTEQNSLAKQISQKQLSEKTRQEEDEEEEKRIIEEMRSVAQSRLDEPHGFKMLSRLSKYEEEFNIKDQSEDEGDNTKQRFDRDQNDEVKAISNKATSQVQKSEKIMQSKDNNDSDKSFQDDGRITSMMKDFEKNNPNLINYEEDEMENQAEKSAGPPILEHINAQNRPLSEVKESQISSMQRLSPMSIEAPPNPENRNFNENDVLGNFDRDDKGSLILLENDKQQIVDKNGRLVNEKGYLIDDKNGDVVDSQMGRIMFTKSELDDNGELPAPFSLEKYNFNPLEIFGHLEFDSMTGKPSNLKDGENGGYQDQIKRDVNRSGFMVDKDGNLVDRNGRKKFDRRLLSKHDNLPQLLNYKGKKFDVRDVLGDFERDPSTGDAIIRRSKDGTHRDKNNKKVNSRGYLVDHDGNIIDKKGNKLFDKYALSPNGEFPKIFPFSKFNVATITGDFEIDPLGNPMLTKDKKNPKVLRDNRGRRVNQQGYLIDDKGNVIDKNGNKVFNKQLLSENDDIPKVFRKGVLRKDTQDSFSRIMSEIEDLERRQGSDYEGDYYSPPRQQQQQKGSPTKASPSKVSPAKRNVPQVKANTLQQHQLNQLQQNDDKWEGASSGGNTSIESQMEDTPSNYNIPNQRFDYNYEVDEIAEDGKEARYNEAGQRVYRGRNLRAQKIKQKRNFVPKDNPTYVKTDRDAMMGMAYGEGRDKRGNPKMPSNNPNQITQSKLSHLAQSISGFYKDPDRNHDGLSSRMKESEVARRIPNHKDKKQQLRRKDSRDNTLEPGEVHGRSQSSNRSMMSLNNQSNANFQQMMKHVSRQGQPGMTSRRRLNGMETIYLQRLEPTAGRKVNKGKQNKARFRECHDRVHNDPELLAEDLTIKDELESLIQDNFRSMQDQMGSMGISDPNTARYYDVKKIALIKDKILKEGSGKDSAWGAGSSEMDEDGLNIFYGNRRNYEREKKRQAKINIGKKPKY